MDNSAEGIDELRRLAALNPEIAATFETKLRERSTPKVPPWAHIYVKAWSVLEHDRALGHGGGMTRIHYSSISRYGRDIGMSGDALQRLVFFVQALDDEYLSFVNEQIKQAQEAAKQR